MIMMNISSGNILLVFFIPFVFFYECASTQATTHCPANTFTCKDGSCIPFDWVGDGEIDCEDASDESTASESIRMHLSATNNSTTPETNLLPSRQMEEIADDPFDSNAALSPQSVTAPQQVLPSLENANSTALRRCPNDIQQRVDQCSNDLINWESNIDKIDFTQISLLNDKESLIELNQGCDLITEYRTCVERIETDECRIPEVIAMWGDMDLYACQLLLPSLHEHEKCFSSARDSRCGPMADFAIGSPLCRLLSSVSADLTCVERLSSEFCDEAAVEVIDPIHSETIHLFEHLRCMQHAPSQVTPTISDISTMSKTESIECPSCANVLQTMLDVEVFCSSEPNDIWALVRKVVCAQKDKLANHSDCFIESAKQTKCDTNPSNETVCGAVDQFNANIDCAIRVLNDVCSIEAQDIVIGIQDKLNDEMIMMSCYEKKQSSQPQGPISDDGFSLNPVFPRCTSDQENAALICLVELTELNKQLMELQTLNFLMELSDGNSTLVNYICNLYEKYETCLNNSVFVHSQPQYQRCAFSSPINTIARIGLAPICSLGSRDTLQRHRDCIATIRDHTSQCQSGLASLGPAINYMLQGIHSEALLCKSFYLIRGTFDCGENLVKQYCSQQATDDLRQLRNSMSEVGVEEGCPSEQPSDLDEIIAKPVTSPVPPQLPPHAAPLPTPSTCDPAEQQKFTKCAQPLIAFQPHPLAVIKQPKRIDEACNQFRSFMQCRANISCKPLWAEGMSAMFQFACGEGRNSFELVRHCVRKTTTRDDIRSCVSTFSRGAPQMACESSNALLACAVPVMNDKCGADASQFITDYIQKFALAIDPSCRITAKENEGATIRGYNCTIEQDQMIKQCAAPLNELSSRIDELFKGGLQSFLANVKNLAPVFAQGCNLTTEFRECVRPVLERNSQCVVSSCMILAGENICNQQDTAKAIDDNLSCIFKQASTPEFGKCLRTTIATLKTFTLASLRTVMPRFISCIEHIVVQQCGKTPLHLLKAISSTDICPMQMMSTSEHSLPPTKTAPSPNTCTAEMKSKQTDCVSELMRTYRMLPIAIINDASDIDMLCQQLSKVQSCTIRACEQSNTRAVLSLLQLICSRKEQYRQHATCLTSVATSVEGSTCLKPYLTSSPETRCASLSSTAECAAPLINSACGSEALTLSFDAMNQYAEQMDGSCSISVPSVSLNTGCSESDLVEYLECETNIDRFAFNPISFIRNASRWDEFCASVQLYKSCVSNMSCKFEPVSSANSALFESLCADRNIQSQIECLSQYIQTEPSEECLQLYSGVDLLAKDAPMKLCKTLSSVLSCASDGIEKQCGAETLKKVHAINSLWSQHFDSSCILRIDSTSKQFTAKPQIDFSSDSEPSENTNDQTSITSTMHEHEAAATTGDAAKPEPQPEPEPGLPPTVPEPSAEPEPSSVNEESPPQPEPTLTSSNHDTSSAPHVETDPVAEPQPEPTDSDIGDAASPEPIPEPDVATAEPKAEPEPNAEPEPEPTLPSNNRTKGSERSKYPSSVLLTIIFVILLRV